MATTLLQHPLFLHAVLAATALWPALRLLKRAGLPAWYAATLGVPVLGFPLFATLLAFKPWPTLPPREKPMHPRERARLARERERAAAATPAPPGG